MYTSPESSFGREFPRDQEGLFLRLYPIVDRTAPPQNEALTIGSVRLRYPFEAPLRPYLEQVCKLHGDEWYTDDIEVFDVFFYIPVPVLADPSAKCRNLVIMFQGVNETRPWNSWLYDRLGEALAQRNIASILLPTPFHLNRSAQLRQGPERRESWAQLTRDLVRPTEAAEPTRPYANFYQTFLEAEKLSKLVRRELHRGELQRNDPWRVYEKLFDRRTRISLLGFSMGGLRSLALILMEDNRYDNAILLSSGGPLASLQPPDVGDDDWVDYVEGVRKIRRKALKKDRGQQVAESFDDLSHIFFTDDLGVLRSKFEELADQNRILVIIGTKDKTRSASILRMQRAELHTIAGMDHKLAEDIQFELHYSEIVDTLVRFLQPEHLRVDPLSRKDIREQLSSQLPVPISELKAESLAETVWNVQGATAKKKLMRLYVQSKARFATDADLVESLIRNQPEAA